MIRRFPHGVKEVKGVYDPAQARIAVHGWFADPAPYFEGALTEDAATPALNAALDRVFKELAELPRAGGLLAAEINLSAAGTVTEIRWLSDTLIINPAALSSELTAEDARNEILTAVFATFFETTFPEADGTSRIVIPLVFE